MSKKLACLSLVLAACGGELSGELAGPAGGESTSAEPATVFSQRALLAYQPEERAYVMGHALAVHFYSQTLPRYVDGTGFRYQPGVSASSARVPYEAGEIFSDQIAEGCYVREDGSVRCPEPATPNADPTGGNDPVNVNEGYDLPNGDPSAEPSMPPGDDESRPTPDDPWLDDDCETFLDPAAMEAREMSAMLDAEPIMMEGFTDENAPDYLSAFEEGMRDAMNLEDLHENTDYSEPEHLKDYVQHAGLCDHSPLILDLDDNGVEISTPEDGVLFDLKEEGSKVRTAWPKGDDVLLVMDRNGDGQITHGGELFGTNKREDGSRASDGFQTLSALDSKELGGNEDGVVDRRDEAFEKLQVWRDENRNGISEPTELRSLKLARVLSLDLTSVTSDRRDEAGNKHGRIGQFLRLNLDGSRSPQPLIDVWFRVQSAASLREGS